MGKINVLPFAVANLIAAGEVVDRPASVIKELMENSIDAGATRITVEIQNGGITLMRVSDNGCGMSKEDLPIALRRHATSKIRTAEDLDGIFTLGFRGEALAAIASVSDVRILSKTEDAEYGSILEAHAGEIGETREQGCSTGTTVIVENLFANVPARRKFLKKDVTEAMAVCTNVEKVALSHPEIAMRLIVDGTVKLDTAGDGNLQNTIYAVCGKEFASRMIAVESENEGIRVNGYIGRSDNFKGNRNHQNFFINGRFVKSKTAMAALEQAYTSYMPPEKFPACVLFITINPTRVDVNVHPAKLEVKFSNEKLIFEAIYYTVRSALESNVQRPSMELSFTEKKRRENPFASRMSDRRIPVEDGKRTTLASQQLSYDLTGQTQPQPQIRMPAKEFRDLYINPQGTKAPTVRQEVSPVTVQTKGTLPVVTAPAAPKAPPKTEPIPPAAPVSAEERKETSTPKETAPVKEQPNQKTPTALPKEEQPIQTQASAPAESLPPRDYRILGEVFNSYVIVEVGDKMLLIDKHAAHERILFEGLKERLKTLDPCSQILMLPIDVMMTSGEVEALKEYRDELEKIGFSMQYARNTVSVDAIPEGIDSAAVEEVLQTMAGRILSATGSVKLTRDILFEKALYQAACKAAIKAGRVYPEGHVEWLVKKLMELPDITFCPHGRPVALELSHNTLDKQFDRTGF